MSAWERMRAPVSVMSLSGRSNDVTLVLIARPSQRILRPSSPGGKFEY